MSVKPFARDLPSKRQASRVMISMFAPILFMISSPTVPAPLNAWWPESPGVGFGLAVIIVVIILAVANRFVERWRRLPGERRFRAQIFMLGLTVVGFSWIVLVLPIAPETRGQVINALGIIVSATIALSSTTLLGNLMAGLMLRSVHHYRPGDTIRVGGHIGRVTDRGLIATEIQTEEADLILLPNLFLAQQPVEVVRSTGTVVSANVSLGYDIPRLRIQELLKAAAEAAGLKEPFVQVVDLGDYSVVYRAGGLLLEVKSLLSTRSKLRASMLDALHEGGVEIVSPKVIARRELDSEQRLVPPIQSHLLKKEGTEGAVEDIAFDKASEAASIEILNEQLEELVKSQDALGERAKATSPSDKTDHKHKLARLATRIEQQKKWIEQAKEALRGD